MTRRRFTEAVSVTLDALGNSLIVNGAFSACMFSPTAEDWTIDRVVVSAGSHAKEALCVVYQRFVSVSTEVGRTYAGSSGDTMSDEVTLTDGDSLHVVWTGGDAGAVATCRIQGWATVPERGFRA